MSLVVTTHSLLEKNVMDFLEPFFVGKEAFLQAKTTIKAGWLCTTVRKQSTLLLYDLLRKMRYANETNTIVLNT